ncbi:MAG: Gfo/Idh/MocA family oxidoreductase [Chloroflexota bacterium]
MLKLAILSFWHVHAKDYLQDAAEHPDTTVVALWDEIPERGQQEAEKHNLQAYQDLDELLSQPDIDGIIVTTPTNLHEQVMVAAAKAKKHIFTEKVVAATTSATTKIFDVAQANAIQLCVSLPRLYHGYTQAIKQIVAEGKIGQVTYARVRLAHDGSVATEKNPNGWLPAHFYNIEQAQGGALIDLGCHPVYLLQEFLGRPHTVQATFGYHTQRPVEDQAVVTLGYLDGRAGIAETGFVSARGPIQIELQGTEGWLRYGFGEERLELYQQETAQIVTVDLPQDGATPFELWVDQIAGQASGTHNLDHAYRLTEIMEAAYLSVQQNQTVLLDD